MKKWIFAALIATAGFMADSTSAGVIYNWQQLSPSSSITSSTGILEISDAAWLGGHIDLDQVCSESYLHPCSPSVADSPILQFKFGVDELRPINASPDTDVYYRHLIANLDIAANGALDGGLYGEDFTGFAELGSGRTGLWTIFQWASDEDCWDGQGEYPEVRDFCGDATGTWVLDASTLPATSVPGPSPLPLFAAGVLALLWIGQRVRRSRSE